VRPLWAWVAVKPRSGVGLDVRSIDLHFPIAVCEVLSPQAHDFAVAQAGKRGEEHDEAVAGLDGVGKGEDLF
jgi:hypothetical protein